MESLAAKRERWQLCWQSKGEMWVASLSWKLAINQKVKRWWQFCHGKVIKRAYSRKRKKESVVATLPWKLAISLLCLFKGRERDVVTLLWKSTISPLQVHVQGKERERELLVATLP